jgi:hypothetical protein
MNSPLAEKWYSACEDEVNGLDKIGTWEPLPWFEGAAPVGSKWVFKTKRLADGTFEKVKARLVIRGDSQKPGIDYGEIFAPVAHNTLARLLLSIAAACDLEVDMVDICQAFLNADLQEEIYMKPAPGVNQILGIPESYLLRLKRSLYGLKQAPRNWSLTFINWMIKEEKFSKASTDDCLFKQEYERNGKKYFILLLMYVDDNIIISNDRQGLDAFKLRMHEKFKIVDKGPIANYLGVQVKRDRQNKTLTIFQEGYVNEILTSVGIQESDSLKYDTPLPAGIILKKNQEVPYELDLYRSLIGSLIYLSQWTRIDITHAVSVLAAHMSNPSRDHHVALKHLLHYLHGTRSRGITYHGYDAHGINEIYCFVDADFAGDTETRKSRTGMVVLCNGGAVAYKSKLQTVISCSTTDAECFAACYATKEIAYLRDVLRRIGIPQSPSGTITYEDNAAIISIAKTGAQREATKHIAIARMFLRYHENHGTVKFRQCHTKKQLADFLTKSLGRQPFQQLTSEAMGYTVKKDLHHYGKRDWKSAYHEEHEQSTVASASYGILDEGELTTLSKISSDLDKATDSVRAHQVTIDSSRESQVMSLQPSFASFNGSSSLAPNGVQGGMKKVALIYCNTMLVASATTQTQEIVCEDINDFIKYDRHYSRLVDETMLDVQTKQYGTVTVVSSIHVS